MQKSISDKLSSKKKDKVLKDYYNLIIKIKINNQENKKDIKNAIKKN